MATPGFPIVDAGMRQLRETGWMHNRVRMIVGSFLVKDLLVDWRLGERHFRYLLVDGDVPQNVGNWQWVAGTGPDASPYHRIFNPVTQSRKFDPTGAYIRRWVPEIAALDDKAIHAPWEVPPLELQVAGITLGDDYPEPLVDHAQARDAGAGRLRRGRRRQVVELPGRAPQLDHAEGFVLVEGRRRRAERRGRVARRQDAAARTVPACCTERRLIDRGG